jgi:hypothetical protein
MSEINDDPCCARCGSSIVRHCPTGLCKECGIMARTEKARRGARRDTVTYPGKTYGHQQIWALVRALIEAGWTVMLRGVPGSGNTWAANINWPDDDSGRSRIGRTPWEALSRAVADLAEICEQEYTKRDDKDSP